MPHTNETMPQLTHADLVEVEDTEVSEVVMFDIATFNEDNLNIEVYKNGICLSTFLVSPNQKLYLMFPTRVQCCQKINGLIQ